jgi:hypothetical protein
LQRLSVTVEVLRVGVMIVGVISVGVMTVGVLSVGVMTLSQYFILLYVWKQYYFSIVNCMIVICIVFDLWGPQVRLAYPL